jgi:hypothetical protein
MAYAPVERVADDAGVPRANISGVNPPPGCPDWLTVHTAVERPELWQQVREDGLFRDVWPEYNQHGNQTAAYFGALFPRFPDFQALFVDERTSRVVARGRTIPFRWDGTLNDLPAGIDAVGLRAIESDATPNTLSALAAEVDLPMQRAGLSSFVIATMGAIAMAHGFESLVAPVRPSQKDRYPITPIDRYADWRREDGLPFDPWMRVHARLGARILRTAPHSMEIVAPVEDWERWTGLAFPEEGSYVFPGGLAPLTVAGGQGEYWEPNVWMLHEGGNDRR